MEYIQLDKVSPVAVKELSKQLDVGELEENTWRELAGYAYGATFSDIVEIEGKHDSPTITVFNLWLEHKPGMKVGHLINILKEIGRLHTIEILRRLHQDGRLAAPVKKPESIQGCQSNISNYSSSLSPQSFVGTCHSRCCQSMASTSSDIQNTTMYMHPSGHCQSLTSSAFKQPSTMSSYQSSLHHQQRVPYSLSLSTSFSSMSSCSTSSDILLISFSGAMIGKVKSFANCLQNDGYNVVLDQQMCAAVINRQARQNLLYDVFLKALFVICLIDEDYMLEAYGQSTSEIQTNTKFITELMSDEYNHKNGTNERFLPFLLDSSMMKTFPPFLDNPPLAPYEYFQQVLANQLRIAQHEKIRVQRLIEESRQHNIRSSDETSDLGSEGSAPKFAITRKNRYVCDEDGKINMEQDSNIKCRQVKIKQKNNSNGNVLKNLFNKIQKTKPRKATETQLIIHATQR